MLRRLLKLSVLSGAVMLGLAGCSGQATKPEKQRPAPVESVSEAQNASDKAPDQLPTQQPNQSHVEIIPIEETGGEQGYSQTLHQDELQDADQTPPLAHDPIVYFAYDSDTVSEEGREILKYYAEKLAQQPQVRVRLEGHTDERGSPEYNLALGERRAKAVKEVLVLYGVSPERIDIISYGEMHPAVEGHNEAAWAKNRRVELVFIK